MYLSILFVIFVLVSWQDIFHPSTLRSPQKIGLYSYCILILILISTFRWEVGTDWGTYYLFYNTLSSVAFDGSYMEPGFNLFTSINKVLVPYYTYHLFVIAVISIGFVAVTIQRYSVYPFVSMLIWFSMSLSNLFPVRQTIAIAILVYGTKYIIQKEKIKFVVLLLIAVSFHYSAIVFSPAYYIFNRYYSRKILLLCILGAIFVSIVAANTVSDILYMVGGDFFEKKLSYYMEQNSDNTFGSAYSVREILLKGLINRSLLFIIPFIFMERRRKTDILLNGFFNLYCFASILFALFVPLSPVLGRFATYYDFSQFFLIPYFFNTPFSRRSLYFIFLLVIFYSAIRFKGVVMNYKDEYIPYTSIFSV